MRRQPKKFKVPTDDVLFAYPIGELASRMKRSSDSIRNMIKRNLLPDTPFKINDRRYFTDEQMNLIVNVAKECNIRNGVSFEKCDFTRRIYLRHYSLMKKYGIAK